MQEAKNPTAKPIDSKERKELYYTTKSKKVVDFLIGFIGSPAVLLVTTRYAPGYIVLVYLFCLVLCAVAFVKERRFIGLGILIVLVAVPLIIFGSCLAILGVSR